MVRVIRTWKERPWSTVAERDWQEQSSNRNVSKIICDNAVNDVMNSNRCRCQSTVGTWRFPMLKMTSWLLTDHYWIARGCKWWLCTVVQRYIYVIVSSGNTQYGGESQKQLCFTFGKDNSRQTERYLGALYFSGRRKPLSSRHIRVLINKGLRSVCLKTIT